MGCSVRIEPRMQCEPALMCLLNRKFKGIVFRVWGLSHFSVEIIGPGFVWRVIKSICCRSNLKNNRIKMQRSGSVKQSDHLFLLLPDGQPWSGRPIDIGYCSDLNTPE